MNTYRDPETLIAAWLDDGPVELPADLRQSIAVGIRTVTRRRSGIDWPFGRVDLPSIDLRRFSVALGSAVVIVLAAALALNFFANQQGGLGSSPSASPMATAPVPPVDLGIFEPVAGRIVYGSDTGIWGFDPAAPDRPRVQVTEAGTPIGWSSDGTRLLIMRDSQLFILHADGSETEVIGGLSVGPVEIHGTLYAVDADSASSKKWSWGSISISAGVAFSPDGTQIAYVEGAGDHSNSVWVMAADGSGAHRIVSNENDRVAAGHVRGLAWSPAGDRITLALGGTIYTFAADGSGFTRIAGGDSTCGSAEECSVKLRNYGVAPYWSPDGSQIAYTTGCSDGSLECGLAIVDADGSNAQEFSYALSGPWHPGVAAIDEPAPSPSVEPTAVAPPAESGTPIGWSSDGTRLLVQQGNETLFILHADGSETEVADISKFNDSGSARPSGATISPDGSRVVFAGLTKTSEEGHTSCHDGALFVVDADGGSAEVLWESQAADEGGIVRFPTFSPDGTQIAFADGYCDHRHSVWVMNADGSDQRRIVSIEEALHVLGLAWSPAGDRLALQTDYSGTFMFAPDGSELSEGGRPIDFCWPGRRC